MLFLPTVALLASILTKGVMAAPNGLVAASGMAFAVTTIAPTPQYTAAFAQYTPNTALATNQIVLIVKTVTDVSNDINIALTKVTTSVTFRDLTKIGAAAVQGFTKIVSDIGQAVAMLPGTPLISGGIADTIVEVLVGFVEVHQALLNTVIGKHSIFAQFGLTAPLAAVLRLIEAGVDGFAFAIIGVIPTKKVIIQTEIAKLDVTVKSTISVYDQICVPSLTFPKKLPHCIKFGRS